jgi:hypothetical protein
MTVKRFAACLMLVVGGTSCRAEAPVSDADGSDVLVTVKGGVIDAPDSIGPGWRRLRVEEDGAGHIVVVFRLAAEGSDENIAAFLSALDTGSVTPPNAVALGGPEVGDSGEIIVRLEPGFYVLGCVRPGKDKHRHASTGEMKLLVVRNTEPAAAHSSPPAAAAGMRLVDFAYIGPDTLPAGANMLRVENSGAQDHQLRLVRLRPGSSMRDWLTAEDPRTHGRPVTGVARIGPGQVAYLPMTLAPGSYVASCLIQDPRTKTAHIELGMFRAIEVH